MLEDLYGNIGNKIKWLAKIIFVLGALASFIAGFALMCVHASLIVFGALLMCLGPFAAWFSTWFLYAFGSLVADVHELRRRNVLGGDGTIHPRGLSDDGHVARKRKESASPKPTEKAKLCMELGILPEYRNGGYVCPVCDTAMDTISPCKSCGYMPPQENG